MACFALQAWAVTHTVSNEAYLPAQFSTIQSAHDAAGEGDTLLVSGTGINYGTLLLSKKLAIFGTTFKPGIGPQFEMIRIMGPETNGSEFLSLHIANIQFDETDVSTSYNENILRRCYVGSIYLATPGGTTNNHCYNWLIEGCVFYQTGTTWNMFTAWSGTRFENFTIRNNVFNGSILELKYCLVEHNLFIGTNPGSDPWTMEYCTVQNNIIYGRSVGNGLTSCVINNNITFGGTDNTFEIPANASTFPYNIGINNLEGIDPMLVDAVMDNYNQNSDYHLAAGSPGIGAGTGGTDIGIFNDGFSFRPDGEPDIPLVREVIIPGGNTVPAEGSFQVTIHSVSHQ